MVSEDDVLKIARLANLSITEGEKPKITAKLNSILDYIEQLNELDVSSVEAMAHVHGSTNVFRADEVHSSIDPEAILRNTPDRSGRFVRVPIIIAE